VNELLIPNLRLQENAPSVTRVRKSEAIVGGNTVVVAAVLLPAGRVIELKHVCGLWSTTNTVGENIYGVRLFLGNAFDASKNVDLAHGGKTVAAGAVQLRWGAEWSGAQLLGSVNGDFIGAEVLYQIIATNNASISCSVIYHDLGSLSSSNFFDG